MDNRLNKIRKEMNLLREEMLRAEGDMHDRIGRGEDSSEAAVRVLELRMHLAAKIAEWTAMGGLAILPTVEQRLKEKREPSRPRLFVVPKVPTTAPKKLSSPKTRKRRLAARA